MEEEVEEEEKEAFQRLRERKGEGAGPTWLLSTIYQWQKLGMAKIGTACDFFTLTM